MVSRAEWCPGLQEDAYQGALGLAWAELSKKELAVQAKLAGGTFDGGKVQLKVFNREAVIDPLCATVTMDGRPVKDLGAILILHYLAQASEAQSTGRTLSYRQVPGGNIYYSAFKTRVIEYIGATFHHYPAQLICASRLLGGKKLEFGDASVVLLVLPKLPVTVIVWKGDDEVRGTANVLFDESAPRFLNAEDLAAVGTFVVSQLIKARTNYLRDVHSVNMV